MRSKVRSPIVETGLIKPTHISQMKSTKFESRYRYTVKDVWCSRFEKSPVITFSYTKFFGNIKLNVSS